MRTTSNMIILLSINEMYFRSEIFPVDTTKAHGELNV